MNEVNMSHLIAKSMRRLKRADCLTSVTILTEHEVLDIDAPDALVKGRIDIVFRFVHDADEEAYLAVECKRVAADQRSLNISYVGSGVDRYATGQYSLGHAVAMMLGLILVPPLETIIRDINKAMQTRYGDAALLSEHMTNRLAHIHQSALRQRGRPMQLIHIFSNATPESS